MGYLRFFAAFAVAAHHLWGMEGNATVYCFYAITGFVIAYLCSEVYVGRNAKRRLLESQALRIYPTYWASLFVSILLILAVDSDMQHVHEGMQLPNSFNSWFRQVTSFGLLEWPFYKYPTRIIPSGWSLNIILVHYIFMTLFIGSSYRRALCFLAASIAVTIGCVASGRGITLLHLYFSFYGPSVAFASGAVAYHLSKRLPPDFMLSKTGVVGMLALMNLLFYLPHLAGFWVDEHPIYRYFVFVIATVVVALLFTTERKRRPSKLNLWAGDLSYPIFLLHWPAGGIISVMQGLRPGNHSFALFLPSLILSMVIGWAIVMFIEKPLKEYRVRLRQ